MPRLVPFLVLLLVPLLIIRIAGSPTSRGVREGKTRGDVSKYLKEFDRPARSPFCGFVVTHDSEACHSQFCFNEHVLERFTPLV